MLVDQSAEICWQRATWKFVCQIFRDCQLFQQFQSDLTAKITNLQVLLKFFQGTLGEHDINGSVSAEKQQHGWFAAAGECGDEIESGGISPVKILEYHHQRYLGTQELEQFANFAHHAFASRAQN